MDSVTQRGIPVGQSEESASMMSEPSGDGWEVESVSMRKAKNGGFIVTCSKTKQTEPSQGNGNMPTPARDYKSEDYAFSNLGEAMNYVASEFQGGPGSGQGNQGMMASAAPAHGMGAVEDY